MGVILTWPPWHLWSQIAFNSHVVYSPNDCDFSGTPAHADNHQARACQRQAIACPFDRFQVTGTAQEFEHEHFPHYPMRACAVQSESSQCG